jgi:phosphate uptake regulator
MLELLVQFPRLAEDAQTMVLQSLDAFVRGDADLARHVIAQDDNVDQLTVDSFRACSRTCWKMPARSRQPSV